QARWRTSVAALQTATQVQSQSAQNLLADQGTLGTLVTQSQGAAGALQAIQAQQLQITQDRATALEQARQTATQAQSAQIRARFLGDGPQYTPSSVDFYGN